MNVTRRDAIKAAGAVAAAAIAAPLMPMVAETSRAVGDDLHQLTAVVHWESEEPQTCRRTVKFVDGETFYVVCRQNDAGGREIAIRSVLARAN